MSDENANKPPSISVYFADEDEKAEVQKAADADSRSLSQFANLAILEKAREVNSQTKAGVKAD